MDLIEVKHDFDCDAELQCNLCLSVGRKLAPLGLLANIYMKITEDLITSCPSESNNIEVCWECKSLLKKVLMFQKRVEKSQELLHIGQSFIYGPLSSLTSVTLNDTQHTIYLNENHPKTLISNTHNISIVKDKSQNKETSTGYVINTQSRSINEKEIPITSRTNKINDSIELGNLKIHNEFVKEDDIMENVQQINVTTYSNMNKVAVTPTTNLNVNDFSSTHNTMNDDFSAEDDSVILEVKQKTDTKSKDTWAKKRAEQNKKPKFKMVSITADDAFTNVQINHDELLDLMMRDRDSKWYLSKRFKCDICVITFNDEKGLEDHNVTLHRKFSGDRCYICQTKIDDKRHLLSHMMQHYAIHKCIICDLMCRNIDHRNWHHMNEHKNVFQCLTCGLKFRTRRQFYIHYKEWHEKYICDYCGVTFKMRYSIKEHIRKQHSPLTCQFCNKTFKRYNGLWRHNKLMHTPLSTPSYCVECDRSYKDIYRYRWHLYNSVKHAPRKKLTIPCTECEKTFTKKIYMTDHYNLVHLKIYKYKCEECDKNFIRNADLVKHKRRIHEGILPPKNKICCVCGRGFATNRMLRNHQRTHNKERVIVEAIVEKINDIK